MISFFRRLFRRPTHPWHTFAENMKHEKEAAVEQGEESRQAQQQMRIDYATGNFIADRLRGITDEGANDAYTTP